MGLQASSIALIFLESSMDLDRLMSFIFSPSSSYLYGSTGYPFSSGKSVAENYR